MDFQGVRPDLVKFEMRKTTGRPAWADPPKKQGFFGRLLSGVGRFFGAVAAPLSFMFPPAALAAAGMYGVAQIGDQIQYKAYARMMKDREESSLQNASFPGLEMGGGSAMGFQPATGTSAAISTQNEMVMNVLFARDGANMAMAQHF